MKRTRTMRIGEVLGDFLKSSPLIAAKLAEARLPEYWVEVVGESVATFTSNISLEKGALYVNVQNSVIRHEIFMRRDSLKEQLNEKMGFRLINVIIVK